MGKEDAEASEPEGRQHDRLHHAPLASEKEEGPRNGEPLEAGKCR